jgi:microcystin-dependent protein
MSQLPELTNEFIADSYKGLLHTSNQPVNSSELRQVYDGLGNQTALKISNSTIAVGPYTFPTNGTFGQTLVFDSAGNLTAGSLFPVGAVFFTTNDTNPSTYLGGTWQRIAQGKFVAGVGNGSDGTYSRTISAGDSGGKYQHILTESEMPSHNHTGVTASVGVSGDIILSGEPSLLDGVQSIAHQNKGHTGSGLGANKPLRLDGQVFLDDTGSDQPHENTPPTFGLYIWSRIA